MFPRTLCVWQNWRNKLQLTKKELNRIAREQGFVRDTLEKVYRLQDILVFMNSHPLMKERLALKGGTAINLTVFNLPRLSVDIDLDYSVDIDREGMLEERKIIAQDLEKYMFSQRYEQSPKSKSRHSLESCIYVYTNTAGVRDNIKIEINYSMRTHVLPLVQREVVTNGILERNRILAVAGIELFGSKIKALLDRAAARDLYDVSNMIKYGLFDNGETDLLRKCTLFYMAVGNDEVPEMIDIDKIDDITFRKIHTDLLPVKRLNEEFNLINVKKVVKEYLTDLMQLTETEKEFLKEFRQKHYRPELLFEDKEIVRRLENHPMALWKMQQ